MPVIQMGNPFTDALGAYAAMNQQGFVNNQQAQMLALAKLKQEQDNAIAQGNLANNTALVQPTIQHMGAETGLLGSQTAGQNIQNQWTPQLNQANLGLIGANTGKTNAETNLTNQQAKTVVPSANADIALKSAMGSLYGSEAQHNQAETNTLIPAQANQMNAAAAEAGARTGLTNEQTTLMQKMGVISKNGTVNAANAWQVINTDPYLKNVVPSWMGQNPQLVAASPAFQGLDAVHQAAVMAILNEPGVRKDVASPVQTQDAAYRHAGSIVNTIYGSPTDFNSLSYKISQGNPTAGLAFMQLNAAIAKAIQASGGQIPTAQQVQYMIQGAANGGYITLGGKKVPVNSFGLDPHSAQTLVAPLNLPQNGP